MDVVSTSDRHASWIGLPTLATLGATECDFVWLQHNCQGTLVKIHVRVADEGSSTIRMGREVAEALEACDGDLVFATLVPSSRVQAWGALNLRPSSGCAATVLPSSAEVQFDLCNRYRHTEHPWRSGCRCGWALLPRRSENELYPPPRGSPLRSTAFATRDAHTRVEPALAVVGPTHGSTGSVSAAGKPVSKDNESTSGGSDLIACGLSEWGLVSPSTVILFTDRVREFPAAGEETEHGDAFTSAMPVANAMLAASPTHTMPSVPLSEGSNALQDPFLESPPPSPPGHSTEVAAMPHELLSAVLRGASFRPPLFSRAQPASTVLLCGAPGVGKTALVQPAITNSPHFLHRTFCRVRCCLFAPTRACSTVTRRASTCNSGCFRLLKAQLAAPPHHVL